MNLGLTLVELCFGRILSDLEEPFDVDPNETITRMMTAQRLLDHVENEGGNRYGDVVRRCLFCPFDIRDFSVDNEAFQQIVFDNIVTPLVDNLNDFNGKGSVG